MAYEKTIWKNREVERPRTFEIQDNEDNTITLIPSEGDIIEAGTPIVASTMNKIETGLEEAHEAVTALKSDVTDLQNHIYPHLADYEYKPVTIVNRQIRTTKQSETKIVKFKLDNDIPEGEALTVSLDGGVTEFPFVDIKEKPILKLEKGYWEVVAEANFFILRPRGGGGDAINGQETIRGVLQDDVRRMDTVFGKTITDGFEGLEKLPDPDILPIGNGIDCSFSPDGVYLAVAYTGSPYLSIYKRDGDVFTKLPDPDEMPSSAVRSCTFSLDGDYLAVIAVDFPRISVYKRDGDVFTKLPNLVPQSNQNMYRCTFSVGSSYLAVGHNGSPSISVYKRNGDEFSKLSASYTTSGQLVDCTSPSDGGYLYFANSGNYSGLMFKRNGDQLTQIHGSGISLLYVTSCAFSPDGTYLALSARDTPLAIYKRDGDVFTKLPDPDQPPVNGSKCVFSLDGIYLAISHTGSPYLSIYKRDGDVFTKLNVPSLLPGDSVGCSFSPDTVYLAAVHINSPYLSICKAADSTGLEITPANNILPQNFKYAGYANEDGTVGQEIEMVKLFEKI